MIYCSAAQMAQKWQVSERTVRNYCALGRVPGAFLTGKTWNIPADAPKPPRTDAKPLTLLDYLRREKKQKTPGGIYHKVQVDLTYNSNHMEGSRLTHDQTRHIFETNTVGVENEVLGVDDIIEAANHFRCIDLIIDNAHKPLTESLIKQLHLTLKSGTSDSRLDWFQVGDYKKLPNEVGGRQTTLPEETPLAMHELVEQYRRLTDVRFDDILDFHHRFESIHPFQDGNGRVGRLIMFKECLRWHITPFMIDEKLKLYYYRGLHEWKHEKGYLRDTCLAAQDQFKVILDYYRIPYSE